MSLQTLDDDTLSEIVSYLRCWDALQFSLVARSTHTIAKYHALRYASIYTYDGQIKFCRYMTNEMRHRSPYIHTLDVQCLMSNEAEMQQTSWLASASITAENHKAAGAIFAAVLENASNMKRLTLNRAEVWMEYEPRITEAIISMPNLEELVLRNVGPQVSRVIHNMRSTPYKLGIPEVPRLLYYVHHHFPLAANLRILSVRHLVLYGDSSVPSVAHLARAFPDVEILDLGSSRIKPPPCVGVVINWPRLVHLEGIPESLAKWRNITPIHSVCIPSEFDTSRGDPGLFDGIRSAQPVVLAIVMIYPSADSTWELMTASARLRYLSMEAYNLRRSPSWQRDLEGWFTRLLPLLIGLDIVCLEIRCCPRKKPVSSMHSTTLSDASDGSAEYENCTLVRSALPPLATSISSLQYFSINVFGCYGEPSRHGSLFHPLEDRDYWWRLYPSGEERLVEPIDAVIGRRVAQHLRSPKYDHLRPIEETMTTF